MNEAGLSAIEKVLEKSTTDVQKTKVCECTEITLCFCTNYFWSTDFNPQIRHYWFEFNRKLCPEIIHINKNGGQRKILASTTHY